jgi:hypothetical protein
MSEASAAHHIRTPFFWFALTIGILLPGCFLIPIRIAFEVGATEKVLGWQAAEDGGTWTVQTVVAHGPAAQVLQPGDRILAIGGDSRAARIGPDWFLQGTLPGKSYRIQFARGGATREEQLPVTTGRNEAEVVWVIVYLLAAFAFYAASMTIALSKPEDPTGRHAFVVGVLCTLILLAFASAPAVGVLPGFWTWAALLMLSVSPLHFAFGYHFYAGVPVRMPSTPFWRRVGLATTIAGFSLWAPATAYNVVRAMQNQAALDLVFRQYPLFRFQEEILAPAQLVYKAAGVAAILAVVARNFRILPEGDQRRRLRWVTWGAVIGLGPIGVVALVTAVATAISPDPELARTLAFAKAFVSSLGMAIPITIGYAIVKHRVLGVDIALRLGVQYLLAKHSLSVILLLPLAGLVYTVASHPDLTVSELLFGGSAKFNLILIAVASLGLHYRRQLTALMDKRFFREAYDQEQVLLNLIESLKQVDSIQEISQLFSREIEAALHARRISVFYRDEPDRDFQLVHSSEGSGAVRRLSENSGIISALGTGSHAHNYAAIRKECPAEEAGWLDDLRIQLLVPVPGTSGKLLGVLMLGEKMSEEPYTGRDRKLLQAVAAQIGVVYENLSLRERVKKEQQVQEHVLAHLEERQVNLVKQCPKCGACYDSSAQKCEADGYDLTLSLPVERTVDGKYQLQRLIGRGGMGAVYEATDLRLNRTVAVKVMVGNLFGNSAALRRFAREAQASAKLDHRNIVRIFDFGELRGDGAYLVLEYVPGRTWRQELRQRGTFPTPYAAETLEQLLRGMEAAHRSGVVHRDLKPENILLSPVPGQAAPVVKILDFGLAKVREGGFADPKSQTMTGVMVGTFGYASPEQLNGESIDERTDIYAAGVLALETLTGEIGSRRHAYHTRMEALVPRRFALETLHEDHRKLAEILRKCVATDREARYRTAEEVRRVLVPLLRKCPPIPPPKAPTEAVTHADGETVSLGE